jgi:nucleotide-binding universal stress UspA family protein
MKKVLIPVDGSECSLRAVALVIDKRSRYANPEGLQVHLVNVQPPLSHDISRFASHEQIALFHKDESEKQLQAARELLDASGTAYTVHCEVGHVAETICRLAEHLGCDQLVMGTHGRTALLELVMGSITLKVLHLVKIPVLLVK